MTTFELPSIPNFAVSLTADGTKYTIGFSYFRGTTFCDIKDSFGKTLVSGIRCVDRQWLIPYGHLVDEGIGNFRLEDDGFEYPDYSRFSKHCRLVYYSKEEISTTNAGE